MKIRSILLTLTLSTFVFSCEESPEQEVEGKHKHEHKHQHGHKESKGEGEGKRHGHHHHHGGANEYMNQSDFEDLVERFESTDRDAYQQPEKVLELLGDLKGKTIMDIGAGTGYFSFRLVDAGAKVIAADVDERFQEYIKEKRDSLGISETDLMLRKLPYDSSNLKEGEVDMVIIVNTYHHIENRPEYFAEVRKGLKEGGELVVIDFFKEEMPVGPPIEMKISHDQVKSELFEAGFADIEVNDELLEYQFILRAK